MAFASSSYTFLSIKFLSGSRSVDQIDPGFGTRNFIESFRCNTSGIERVSQLSSLKKREVSCASDRNMDVSMSPLVDGGLECLTGEDIKRGEPSEPSVSTMLMNFANEFDPYEALSTPLYQTATFKQPSAVEYGPYDYTRSGNPTRDVLERLLAKLDRADRALCFTSGMAALAAVTHLVGTGEEIVAGDDMYGGSDRLLSQVIPNTGVLVKRVDTSNLDEVASAITSNTKLVWVESPTNPRQQISDIRKIAEIAHCYGALLLVDNSIMSPVLSQPLELGADIVMHSATKFIAGHSDLMAGVLAIKGERLFLLLSSSHFLVDRETALDSANEF